MIMPGLVSSSSMTMLFSLMIYLSMPAAIAESKSDEQVVEQARIGMLKAISLIKDKKFAEAVINNVEDVPETQVDNGGGMAAFMPDSRSEGSD